MPVKLEHLTTPTMADWQDLNKIAGDTQPSGLNPGEALEHWLNDQRWIMAARFNDRLVGALLAERNAPFTVTLSAPGVRKITQSRGVMHQLLHFISRWADAEGTTLIVKHQHCTPLVDALLKRGFETTTEYLLYTPKMTQ